MEELGFWPIRIHQLRGSGRLNRSSRDYTRRPFGFAGCPNFPNDPVPGTAYVGRAEDVAVRIERRIAENVLSVGSAREIVQVDVVVGAPRALQLIHRPGTVLTVAMGSPKDIVARV